MKRPRSLPFVVTMLLLLGTLAVVNVAALVSADEVRSHGLQRRVPWTTSRVIGSPDAPLPYTVEPTFTNIAWKAPIFAIAEPGSDRLLVIEKGGEKDQPSKLLLMSDDPATTQIETLLEINHPLVYSVAFHPDYKDNGFLYVFSNGSMGEQGRANRISRFTVTRDGTPKCDPGSERIIITWPSAGHDGGGLVFGHDRMLYITTGDGTSDSDVGVTGQDISDLLGGVLRIDVDHPTGDTPYSIPADNPFVDVENARGELWAYGLRNPWRMCVDRETGHIWVGSNGQDLWETVHLIRRGENYGWSVYEGDHPFYLNRQRGPTPFVPPTIEHHHIEARSLTGGVVYYGEPLAELNGVYVYGDYSTGKIWGARHDGTRLTWHRELADTSLQIAGFAVSRRGELLVVDHAGGLFRLRPAEQQERQHDFPRRLSETGVFVSVEDQQPQPGVIAYSVNAPAWTDGATAHRYLAIPGDDRIDYTSSRGWNFSDGAVLVQTLGLETIPGKADSYHRIETRLLTRQQGEWAGYSYRWNDEQTDATLVEAAGDVTEITIAGGKQQTWKFPGRAECMSCHGRAANFVLGLSEPQMNRDHDYHGVVDNQLRAIEHIGLFKNPLPKPIDEMPRHVDPYDADQDVDARARTYLHVNCSVCHVSAGGGNAKMELAFSTELSSMNLIASRPQHATFDIDNAMLIAAGNPEGSVLMHRLSRRGRGQMPPLVSRVVDHDAVRLMHDWIAAMKPSRAFVHDWKLEDLVSSLEDIVTERSFDSGKAAFGAVGCTQCHRFGKEGSGIGPDLSGVNRRLRPVEMVESLITPSKKVAPEFATTVIQTAAGTIVEGRVEQETEAVVVLRSGALAETITIQKSDIEDRALSTKSIMPTGILNTLTKQQVLDLIAYLIADGQPDHPAFEQLSEGESP